MGVVSVCATASTVYIFNFYRVYTCIYFLLKYSYKYSCIVYTRAMSGYDILRWKTSIFEICKHLCYASSLSSEVSV